MSFGAKGQIAACLSTYIPSLFCFPFNHFIPLRSSNIDLSKIASCLILYLFFPLHIPDCLLIYQLFFLSWGMQCWFNFIKLHPLLVGWDNNLCACTTALARLSIHGCRFGKLEKRIRQVQG